MNNKKQKYIAVLNDGELEPEIAEAINNCGYALKRKSDFGGMVTHHFEYASTPNNKPIPYIKLDFSVRRP